MNFPSKFRLLTLWYGPCSGQPSVDFSRPIYNPLFTGNNQTCSTKCGSLCYYAVSGWNWNVCHAPRGKWQENLSLSLSTSNRNPDEWLTTLIHLPIVNLWVYRLYEKTKKKGNCAQIGGYVCDVVRYPCTWYLCIYSHLVAPDSLIIRQK